MEPDLTPMQQRFVHEYCRDLNATRAAARAGYSPATACEQASRLLANANVRAAVEAAKSAYLAQVQANAAGAVHEAVIIASSDLSEFSFDPKTGDVLPPPGRPEALRAVSSVKRKVKNTPAGTEVEVEIRLWSKTDALKWLGQYMGLLQKQADAGQAPAVVILKGVDGELALGLKKEGGDGAGEEQQPPPP